MTTDEIISRCYEHGQPDYVLAADRLKALQDALQQQETAEEAHVNCDECDGEEIPELCPKCFPRYDDARIRRRAVLGINAVVGPSVMSGASSQAADSAGPKSGGSE